MPLTDLIRYFNVADTAGDSTLYPEGERVAAWHRGLRLRSLFQPIVELRRERIVGHRASLLATTDNGEVLDSAAAYASCASEEAIVHFDRLVRTLHALNFLAQRRLTGGYLQVGVHSRHLQAVQSQHGLVYEAILKRCGLAPEDIVLEITCEAIPPTPRLLAAIQNYRQRNYRVALTGLAQTADASPWLAITPDMLALPNQFAVPQNKRMCLLAEDIATSDDLQHARLKGVELGLGPRFGAAEIDCRPTHSSH